jgi:phosphohistidine phosphatase
MTPSGGEAERPRSARFVWLLRHAKTVTDPPPGGSDFDRVLAPRGRRDANALQRLFAGRAEGLGPALRDVPRPQVALVSPSARTVATADLVLASMVDPPAVRLVEDLYAADPEQVMELLRELDDIEAAMVVGHNPTAHELSQELPSVRDKKGRSLAVRHGFPTCALGVYRFEVASWAEVGLGGASLVALMAPPYR